MVDYDLLVASLVDSQSKSEVGLDSKPSSTTNSSFVVDFDSVTGSHSATKERS